MLFGIFIKLLVVENVDTKYAFEHSAGITGEVYVRLVPFVSFNKAISSILCVCYIKVMTKQHKLTMPFFLDRHHQTQAMKDSTYESNVFTNAWKIPSGSSLQSQLLTQVSLKSSFKDKLVISLLARKVH